ncbi:MAG: DUF4926 domain-containing protein [Thermoleophilaceae bacterium]
MAELLDVVELRVDSGRWEAGTRGTVVEVLDAGALVEISDGHGHTEEIIAVPHDALRAVTKPEQRRLLV